MRGEKNLFFPPVKIHSKLSIAVDVDNGSIFDAGGKKHFENFSSKKNSQGVFMIMNGWRSMESNILAVPKSKYSVHERSSSDILDRRVSLQKFS